MLEWEDFADRKEWWLNSFDYRIIIKKNSQKQDQPARKERERVWSAVMPEHRLADRSIAWNSE